MIYTIIVMGSIYGTENAISAFLFSSFLLKIRKNNINNIFFYCDGVLNGNKMFYIAKDEHNLIDSWYYLSKEFSINLNICSSAAYRRGVIDDDMALDLGFLHGNLHSAFKLTGLGTLVKSIFSSDRVVQF
ncbi:sulfurtransferase complex subunit TusD [Buchnera aphidicola (Stegophylla sp.)]|uniref:Sulfurtransferase complex subunit TusD n=1 Tax=Buchnera aphidicola (Stegophylla sp.) TaxID=2315800 RepID=A0A4D6YET5_9GAMM|nr:sulfurtransferase complex subunit TusD [Buchnera aphidicola (Stegophylla sp.)]